ncbi:MAG: hypothetical protein D4S01_10520 [Dehalococcoidia bacterium]|nr:MAG: hypothetical protein D4S01_10520 [Dehalococcoidia bacterium]
MSKKEFIIGILCIFGVVGLINYVRLSAKQGAILDAGIEIVPGEKAIIEIDPCMPNIVFVDSTGTKLEWTVNGRTLKLKFYECVELDDAIRQLAESMGLDTNPAPAHPGPGQFY